jgi:uncharacterized Zn finger protein (UPF0148 family)
MTKNKVSYQECPTCGDTFYLCPKCGTTIHITHIGKNICHVCQTVSIIDYWNREKYKSKMNKRGQDDAER